MAHLELRSMVMHALEQNVKWEGVYERERKDIADLAEGRALLTIHFA